MASVKYLAEGQYRGMMPGCVGETTTRLFSVAYFDP
jgi:hypothetical protein